MMPRFPLGLALPAALVAALALRPAPALALTCSAAAPALAFGTYNVFSASPLTSGGTVTVTCSSLISVLVSFTVTLSSGGSGNASARVMTSGGATLAYQVYMDSARSQVWSNGSGLTSFFTGGYLLNILLPVTTSYNIYAQIPARQNVPPGSYSDVLTVTVIY